MKVIDREIRDLIPAEYNPRHLTNEQAEHLEASLKRFGAVDPAIINIHPDRKNIIIGGHQRLKTAQRLGWDTFPCVELELDKEKERELNIRLNKNTGGWDYDALANYFEVEELIDWGFKDEELFGDVEAEELEAEEDNYEEPDEIHTDIVLGDLIEIGEHRLLCGDSTDSDQVAKLMDGNKADMVFTDPPYGISVVKNDKVGADFGIAKKGKYSEVIADDTTETAQEFFQTCISLGFDNFIIWGGNYFTDFLPFSDGWLIWNKRANTDIRNTFADGEMAWCSFHTPIRIYDQLWNGMIREGEKEKRVHPTQKPIRMLSEIIQDHIKGNLIFDGFLGSGSTMVASHQLNRKCYGMELDPKYCQVIIDRMLKLDETLEVKINGEPYGV